jgi:hypothetical protein
VFEAAMAAIPAMRQWVDPEGVEPITDVLTMAGLRNTMRAAPSSSVTGLFPVGDANFHSDPVLALGLTYALGQAVELVDAICEQSSLDDAAAAYRERTEPSMNERFEFATQLDDQRLRTWHGEPIDFASKDGAYALFTIVAGGVAALADPDVLRVVVRRMGLLDGLRVLDDDLAMQRRIEAIFRDALSVPRPPLGPTSDEMEAIIADAVASAV